MASTPSLRQDLASWDGKDAGAIAGVYERQHTRRGFVGSLIRLGSAAECEAGATWLLKRHLESGAGLTDEQARAFFAVANGLGHWEARLHALQCMGHVAVPAGSVRHAKRLIERGLADENKFVRAWAYSGFVRLAAAHPRYRDEAERLLDDAEANESAASVRARVRQIRKKGFGW